MREVVPGLDQTTFLVLYRGPITTEVKVGFIELPRPLSADTTLISERFRKTLQRIVRKQYGKGVELIYVGKNMLRY